VDHKKQYEAHLAIAKHSKRSRFAERVNVGGVNITVEHDPRLKPDTVVVKDGPKGRVLRVFRGVKP
jgi:hypothetical protein